MNSFGFLLRRIAWQVGVRRERQRWGAVNRETQILSEAENLLGRVAWPSVREIDDLSGEYWQILDLHEQQEKLRQETRVADELNEQLKDQLSEIQKRHETRLKELREQKSHRMEDALGMLRDIEQLKDWKVGTKKKFLTLKVKMQVIQKHEGETGDLAAEMERTRLAMMKLKEDFTDDVSEISKKTDQIEQIEKEVVALEAQIVSTRAELKTATAELNNEVSRLSKIIAELSARIGALENTRAEFYFQVGHYLSSRLDSRDAVIRSVLRQHRPLVARIGYYRRSISFNQRLARRTRR